MAQCWRPPDKTRFELGPPRRISEGTPFVVQEIAPDGRSLVVGESRKQTTNERVPPRIWLWPDGDAKRAKILADGFPLAGYHFVAEGRWRITTDNLRPDLWLWDPA